MSTAAWSSSLNYFLHALESLGKAIDLSNARELSELEKQGLIKIFESTHELAMGLLKAYVDRQNRDHSSTETTREAEYMGLIPSQGGWREMLRGRKEASQSYDSQTAQKLYRDIREIYFPLLAKLGMKMRNLRTGEQTGLF